MRSRPTVTSLLTAALLALPLAAGCVSKPPQDSSPTDERQTEKTKGEKIREKEREVEKAEREVDYARTEVTLATIKAEHEIAASESKTTQTEQELRLAEKNLEQFRTKGRTIKTNQSALALERAQNRVEVEEKDLDTEAVAVR